MIIFETVIMLSLTITSMIVTAFALICAFVIGKDVLQEFKDKRKTRKNSGISGINRALVQSCNNDCEHCEWVTCPKL